MTPHLVGGFALALLPLVVTPGASLALLTRQVTTAGRRAGWAVILGTATGIYLHACCALLGLSAIVMNSDRLFDLITLLGAFYLTGLGLWSWRQAGRTRQPAPGTARETPTRSAYLTAVLANVLNPKAALIPLTLAPQFLDPTGSVAAQLAVLATTHVLLTACWLLAWTLILGGGGRVFRSPRVLVSLNRTAAVVLIALGVWTALR
ncbi:Homoserine/homoserine lactone efflux protein [Actinoalloteichus hoggarensis]|uniref:Homoserine/homoserine lactone efflux protein n=2 Tax=Actinoalloteichus hoggarensis TaxID=1470176 RepID=A0A221W7N6_9PSEU|nr:Homoserine/homoserine lactone efflux protein [Actinoalloteichus hoggarensis]